MIQKKLDEVANLWNKTKDPRYKNLWYKLVKETYGQRNNTNHSAVQRRTEITVNFI